MIIIKSNRANQPCIFMEGNSLMSWDANHTLTKQNYVQTQIYNGLLSGRKLTHAPLAIGGQTQTMINAALSTRITPYIRPCDVYFIWEGTNDMYVNSLDGTTAFNNLITCINTVKNYTSKIVVGTVAARDAAVDPASLMNTDIPLYNSLVRSNASTYGYTVCDIAAQPQFDARADASNATYYAADKLHLVQAGKDIVVTLAITSISSLL